MMRRRHLAIWIGSALAIAGALVLGWCAWRRHSAAVAQQQAAKWLAHRPAVKAPSAAHRPSPPPRRGTVLAKLEVPRLHLSVMVFQGDDARILDIGAGHIPGTALPGARGNVGIAAHRDTYFRPLRGIRANDLITLKTPAGVARFRVTSTEIVRPSDVSVLRAAPGRDLTLVTCYPFRYIGSAPERFIVHARRETQAS